MSSISALRRVLESKRAKKAILTSVILLALVGVFGFFVAPPLVKWGLADQLAKAIHRPVTIEKVLVNPYALSLEIRGLAVSEREGEAVFVSLDSLYLNLQSTSIFRGGPVLGEVRLVNPHVKLVREEAGRYNFSDLLSEYVSTDNQEGDASPVEYSVNNIQLSGGSVEFDDRLHGERHVVSDITLTLPFLSSMAYAVDTFVEPAFSARIDGAAMDMRGKSKPFAESLESELAFNLKDFELKRFFDYLPIKLPIQLTSGTLDANLTLLFKQAKERPATLSLTGRVATKSLTVNESSGAPLLSLKQLAVDLGSADLVGGAFQIDHVLLESPKLHAAASREGVLNWVGVVEALTPAGDEPVQGQVDGKSLKWAVNEVVLHNGVIDWVDESNGSPFEARVDQVEVGIKNLSNSPEGAAELDLSSRVVAGKWLGVDRLAVSSGQLKLGQRELTLGEVRTQGVRAKLLRGKDGAIDWIMPPALRSSRQDEVTSAPEWKVTVGKYLGDDMAMSFEDQSTSPAAIQTIEHLTLAAENITTAPGGRMALSTHFKVNRVGDVDLAGALTLQPLSAELEADIKSVELLPWQPYFAEQLNVDITRGRLSAKGVLMASRDTGKADFAAGFSGQATIGDFYAVDKVNSADFLRWKSFHFGQVDAKLQPDSVSIGEVALSDFFARVIVSPEGKLNLLQLVRSESPAPSGGVSDSASPQPSVPPESVRAGSDGKAEVALTSPEKIVMPVKVGKITLQGGTVRFSDNFVKPNYTANLYEVGGQLNGLSSEPGTVAQLELRGSYDKVAPLTVSAKINPLSSTPYLDLQADIKGIELTSLSSYSGKYAGYAIDKGKLSLFVNYKIENGALEAQNRVFLDQLSFGERVDSPDATSLPVNLAVSLLKNRNGEIDLNLPISGSLNDPEFSVGGLVVKVIVNLFVKVVTSPFALLGSMFGDGEELSYLEFDYGRSEITPASKKRLADLAKALVDRPGLKLEVGGRVDPERDPEGVKRARIERSVRAMKRLELTKQGVESGPEEAIVVGADEYSALLERVYRAAKFPKPRNAIGLVKSLPVEEMEKLLLANSSVSEEDLRELGDQRARLVRDRLLADGISAERMFLLPSKLGDDIERDGAEGKRAISRVDFSLK